MSKRIIVLMLALVVCVATFASAAETAKDTPKASSASASDKAPRLTVVDSVKDYGVVPKGNKLDWSFIVKNTGNADLEIIAARPSCGCTVADFDKVIKPGATGKVNAHVDTTQFAGPIQKTITVETNDPANPTAQLTINATVKPYVEAFPAGYVRFNMLQSETGTQAVTLYSEEEAPFEIVKIESPDEWVTVTPTKLEDPAKQVMGVGRQGQAQYKLDITVAGPKAKLGALAEKIHIVTNSAHQPEFFVNVVGVVRPTFGIDPATGVNFGSITPSDPAATRSIMLRSNSLRAPGAFQVSKAESSIPSVSAAVRKTPVDGEYEVTVQVGKNAKPGDFDGNVKIYTNDTINPVVVLPVKGTVKGSGTASK